VVSAEDGRQAVETFKRVMAEVDLVILDLTMPHLDGEACFRELRLMKPDVKVILSSGYSEQDVVNLFAGKGLAGFIQKPYTNAELIAKVREVLGG
jgi:DNA-binding response OmpR family regulator